MKYTCCRHRAKPVTLRDGSGATSLTIGYEDSHGNRKFTVHAYVYPDGAIASHGGKLDPKFFVDDRNIAYKIDQ